MPASTLTLQAQLMKAELLEENRARVERRKVESKFLRDIIKNPELQNLDIICEELSVEKAQKKAEYEERLRAKRIKEHNPDDDLIKCKGEFTARCKCIETTHGGSTLWTVEDDGSIAIRNGLDGTTQFTIEKPEDGADINCLFATDTTMWAGLSDGKTRIYDQQVFVLAFEGQAHTGAVTAFAQTFDDKTFSTSEDGTVVKWDTEENKFEALSRITDFGAPQRCLHCHGYNLFTGGDDGVVRCFDIETSALLRIFTGHTARVNAMTVLEGVLFTASNDHTIAVWSIADGSKVHVIECEGQSVTSLMTDPIGHHLWGAYNNGTIQVWSSKIDSGFSSIFGTVPLGIDAGIIAMKGVVAIDSIKIWALGHNGINKVWHASKNRVEEAIRAALKSMKGIIEQDEIELGKWADLIATLKEVVRKLNENLTVTLDTANSRNLQMSVYYIWLRFFLRARTKHAERMLADKLECMNNREVLHYYFKKLYAHRNKKIKRNSAALSNLLCTMTSHKQQYDFCLKLQKFVARIEHLRHLEQFTRILSYQSKNAHMRFCYARWTRFVQRKGDSRKKTAMATAMGSLADRRLMMRYFIAWVKYRSTIPILRKNRFRANVFACESERDVRRRAYVKWRMLLKERHPFEQRLVRMLENRNVCLFIRPFYEHWKYLIMEAYASRLKEETLKNIDKLQALRNKAREVELLMAYRQLITETQEEIDKYKESINGKLAQIEELKEANAKAEQDIENKTTIDPTTKPFNEQVSDLIYLLKAKLLNINNDLNLICKIDDRAKKLPSTKLFLEAHAEIKRTVVNMTNHGYDAPDMRWPLTDALLLTLKKHAAEPCLTAIKTMVITYDIMSLDEKNSLMTDREIAVNAPWIEKLADKCLEIKIERYGATIGITGRN